jgi:hypothetical protein
MISFVPGYWAETRARIWRGRLVKCVFLISGIVLPAMLEAQFTPPADDELKMTAEPKAPGADAIYLYREETDGGSANYRTVYERIKVLKEKGKELATIRIPYEPGSNTIAEFEGRTIHADGVVVPLTEKPSDLTDYKSKNYQINSLVYTLPSVEVGSILEYRFKFRATGGSWLPAPTWEVQQAYFVRKAHYTYHASAGMAYTARLGPGVQVVRQKGDIMTLDVTDVPPVPDEDWMPPMNLIRWQVAFYYTTSRTEADYWENEEKEWTEGMMEFTHPSGQLKKAVAEMVGPADSEEQKAQKIYDAVMKLDNTDYSRSKSKAERKAHKIKTIERAEDIWKEQSGNSAAMALLYIALARTAGLDVSPMQVVNRDRAIFSSHYLNSEQLDDYIAVVTIRGKDTYLDPGERMCPYGSLHWKHTLATGFRLEGKKSVIAMTPAGDYTKAVVQRIAYLNIDPQGDVQGTVRIVMNGPDALYWRQVALENDPDEVKKQFDESVRASIPEGVQVEFDHFLGQEDYNSSLMASMRVSGNLGTATGKRLFLPGLFFESQGKHPFVALENRQTPIDVHYAKMEQDEVTYHLPADFTVESAPQAGRTAWPQHAEMKIASKVDGDSVMVDRSMAYNYVMLDSKDYESLRGFYQKIATADQQPLVLIHNQAAKGNS